MKKRNILIIFGGKSFEHDVSIMSASSVYANIDTLLFNVDLLYIDKKGIWKKVKNVESINEYEIVDNYNIVKNYDVIFPLIHGSYGEDGKLQGLLEMYDVKYVGCNTLSSSICMDKVFTKKILDSMSIPNVKYIYTCEKDYDLNTLKNRIKNDIGYPCFIKPSNAGSSIGVKKVKNESELEQSAKYVFQYDTKILIEKYINAREVEIGILGNNELLVSEPGEIIINTEFYSYKSKYKDESTKIVLSDLPTDQKNILKELATKAYRELECRGLTRIDFFIDKDTNEIYLNELNTSPGFTNMSMYPFLFKEYGIPYKELITKLIDLAE